MKASKNWKYIFEIFLVFIFHFNNQSIHWLITNQLNEWYQLLLSILFTSLRYIINHTLNQVKSRDNMLYV